MTNDPTNITPLPTAAIPRAKVPDRHAAALADIRQMHDELTAAHETIGQLKADLHRAEDRITLLNEERNKYRDEAHLFRDKLIELATQQANIGLLTIKAQEIVKVVNELTSKGEESRASTMLKDIDTELTTITTSTEGTSK